MFVLRTVARRSFRVRKAHSWGVSMKLSHVCSAVMEKRHKLEVNIDKLEQAVILKTSVDMLNTFNVGYSAHLRDILNVDSTNI